MKWDKNHTQYLECDYCVRKNVLCMFVSDGISDYVFCYKCRSNIKELDND